MSTQLIRFAGAHGAGLEKAFPAIVPPKEAVLYDVGISGIEISTRYLFEETVTTPILFGFKAEAEEQLRQADINGRVEIHTFEKDSRKFVVVIFIGLHQLLKVAPSQDLPFTGNGSVESMH